MDRYLTTMKGSVRKDSDVSPKVTHGMFINLRSPTEEKFQYKLPKTLNQQYLRKNKLQCRLHYTIKKFDTSNMDTSQLSPNSSLANDYLSIFSRSAKIMKALSSTSHSFRNESVKTRKLLNFDLTPSPKEDSSYENSNSSIDTDNLLTPLNSSLTDSTDNNVSTVEAIDENQNKTPQQNRKHIEKSKRTDPRENTHIWSRASRLMSLLDKEQREGRKETDKDANHKTFQRFLFDSRSNELGRVITASTPRNLFQEFNQETDDRPNTPENIINVIPESISAIKKSHKKEKFYCHEESFTQRMDISVNNDKQLHSRSTTESSSTDVIAETSTASESESQKKYRNPKRTLIYNLDDESSDIRSNFDHNMQQKTTSTGIGLLESELNQIESDEMKNINFSNCESHEESMQSSIDDNDEEKKNRSEENVCNEEVSQSSMQKESLDNCNATSENIMASPTSNPIVSQDTNQVVTPENHVNVLKHMMTESIKKSHKKMKHGNRKKLFESKDVHQEMELAKNERSLLENACNDDQDMKNQTADSICTSSPQNLEFNRPNTPENVNSSRLLLLGFNSVKKSHKKDKRSKRAASFAEYHDYEYHKRSNNLLQSSRYEEENIGIISHGNVSFEVKESPGMSSKKKKLSMPLESSTPKVASASKFLGCKNIDDEFKIYTPIKKRPILLTVTDVPANRMLQERDESMPSTSNEIDYSRCMTPIARFKELRNNEDLASERDNATEFETDTSVLKAADTANLNDNNGRSTPINMSTTELLHNIDSIKKSHRKNKHNPSSRPTSEKKRSYIEESHVNFINNEKMLEERISSSSKHRVDYHCTEKETCNITHEQEKNKNYKETDYNPKPSMSNETKIKDAKSTASKCLINTTPPNSSSAMRLIKLLQTTSIKKSHKKERDMNAQTKYIFMSEEHELSDDGSIFDEEDRLNFMEINDSNTEITTM